MDEEVLACEESLLGMCERDETEASECYENDFDSLFDKLRQSKGLPPHSTDINDQRIDVERLAHASNIVVSRIKKDNGFNKKSVFIPAYYTQLDEKVEIAREIVKPFVAEGPPKSPDYDISNLHKCHADLLGSLDVDGRINLLASALLMPKSIFLSKMKQIRNDLVLSDIFDVPLNYIKLRRDSLNTAGV
jgi:predicted transcriptional regulator